MSKLSEMLANEQARRGITDYRAAAEIGVSQQTYSTWKHGSEPRPNKYAALAEWLGMPPEEVAGIITPKKAGAAMFGRVSDRKEGKYRFDADNVGRRIPSTRYAFPVETNVMEPALLYGTQAWADPSVWPKPGHEVMAHGPKGVAWLGRLVVAETGRAVVENAAGRFVVENVEAIHVVVLSERVPGGFVS